MILSIMTKNISWSEFLFVKSLVMWNILFIFATQNQIIYGWTERKINESK